MFLLFKILIFIYSQSNVTFQLVLTKADTVSQSEQQVMVLQLNSMILYIFFLCSFLSFRNTKILKYEQENFFLKLIKVFYALLRLLLFSVFIGKGDANVR